MINYYLTTGFAFTAYCIAQIIKKTNNQNKDVASLVTEMGAMIQGQDNYIVPNDFIAKYGADTAKFIYDRLIYYDFEDSDIINTPVFSDPLFKMGAVLEYAPIIPIAHFAFNILEITIKNLYSDTLLITSEKLKGENMLKCKGLPIDLIWNLNVSGNLKNCESIRKFKDNGWEYKALQLLGIEEDNVETALKFNSSIRVKILNILVEQAGRFYDEQKETLFTKAYNLFSGNDSELPIAEKPEEIVLKIDLTDVRYKDILQLIDYSLIYTDSFAEDHDHYKTDGYEQCFDSYTDFNNEYELYYIFNDISLKQLFEDCYYNYNCSSNNPDYQGILTCINTVKSILINPFLSPETGYETCWVFDQ